MRVKTVAMVVEDGGCDGNVGGVCMCFVGRDADGDIHCRAGKKRSRMYRGRPIP